MGQPRRPQAGRGGQTREELERERPRVGEVPFSSARKMMTSVHALPQGGYLVLTKGAFDRLPFSPAPAEELRRRQEIGARSTSASNSTSLSAA